MLKESYLLELVKQYAATPEGRKQIKEKFGIDYDPKKDKRLSRADMLGVAEKMRVCLWQHIKRHIKSVALSDIIVEEPLSDENGGTTISLSFRPGAMFRPSLQPEKYPEGVENIVLHFTHGWSAKGYISGEWHGDQVWSRRTRSGTPFMQEAVSEFNSKMKGIAVAELSGDYK